MPMPSEREFADAPFFRMAGFDPFAEEPVLGEPFAALVRDDGVWTLDGTRRDLATFEAGAVRCDPDGRAVTPLSAPLYVQRLMVSRHVAEHGTDMDAHVEDIRSRRDAMPEVERMDHDQRFDAHMHDAIAGATRDPSMSQEDVAAAAMARAVLEAAEEDDGHGFMGHREHLEALTPDAVLARIQRDTGIAPSNWNKVVDYPTYMIEQVRGMARAMLAPILGNMIALEDLRRLEIPKEEVERIGAVRRWMDKAGEARTLPPFRHPSMPGYVTDEPRLAELNGVTVLTFSDFHASYCYAWQSDPDVKPVLDADEAPRDPFGIR